ADGVGRNGAEVNMFFLPSCLALKGGGSESHWRPLARRRTAAGQRARSRPPVDDDRLAIWLEEDVVEAEVVVHEGLRILGAAPQNTCPVGGGVGDRGGGPARLTPPHFPPPPPCPPRPHPPPPPPRP